MKTHRSALAAVISLSMSTNSVMGQEWNYDNQKQWPADQCSRVNAQGVGQSPIDIPEMSCGSAAGYKFYNGDCTLGDLKYTINNHGVKADYPTDGSCTAPAMQIPGNAILYDVAQFHIHTGCENKLQGEGCDAELHMVHVARGADPDYAVMGVMFNATDTVHQDFDLLLNQWWDVSCTGYRCTGTGGDQQVAGAPVADTVAWSPYSLVPTGSDVYKFYGGLTTPPCSEVVNWNSADTVVPISWRQLAHLSTLIIQYQGYRDDNGNCVAETTVADVNGYTSRDVQDIKGRTIEKVCAEEERIQEVPPAAPSSASKLFSVGAIAGAAYATFGLLL